ncbi:hypothetical protein NP233_g11914 [Leucocoprinus birnbaumii]|uniref:Uncharacterized protein n=1 Tax=Leucocoprinus birnbaumii TaxID=56174 RepID=A0AAD5VH90_9AGAR|nr:hypothetical protein NP233_g11914 [Leucocoprinus birnbaumii]
MRAWALDFTPSIDPVTKLPIPIDVNCLDQPGCASSFFLFHHTERRDKSTDEQALFSEMTPEFEKYESSFTDEEKTCSNKRDENCK